MLEYFENDVIIVKLENGIVHCHFKSGVVVDLAAGKELVEKRIAICNQNSLPLLVNVTNSVFFTKECRDFFITPRAISLISALAFVRKSFVQKIILDSSLFFIKKDFPIKAFLNIDNAIKWLEVQKYNQKSLTELNTSLN